jgi:ribonuclease P protein component
MVSAPAWPPRTVAWCCPAGAPRAVPGSPSEAQPAVPVVTTDPATSAYPETFPRAHRLLSPAEFARVFKSGRRLGDSCFTVIATPAKGENPRLGLAVSKKVSKSAVQRNRIKRLVRESFRQHSAHLPAMDIVVMARPGAAGCDNHRLATSIDALLERIARPCAASSST